jgi:hypothetical protein
MGEEEFDSLFPPRPFGTAEAMRVEARLRRCGTLGLALWGRTSDDLRRQLLAPYPQIPSGFDLEDFRELQWFAQLISSGLASSRNAGYSFSFGDFFSSHFCWYSTLYAVGSLLRDTAPCD